MAIKMTVMKTIMMMMPMIKMITIITMIVIKMTVMKTMMMMMLMLTLGTNYHCRGSPGLSLSCITNRRWRKQKPYRGVKISEEEDKVFHRRQMNWNRPPCCTEVITTCHYRLIHFRCFYSKCLQLWKWVLCSWANFGGGTFSRREAKRSQTNFPNYFVANQRFLQRFQKRKSEWWNNEHNLRYYKFIHKMYKLRQG